MFGVQCHRARTRARHVVLVVRERQKTVVLVLERLEHDPMGPYSSPVKTTGHALTAAMCTPCFDERIATLHEATSCSPRGCRGLNVRTNDGGHDGRDARANDLARTDDDAF